MKVIFRKVILNIRLDLEKIFYYILYKYKIAICIGSLLFYQNGNLKTAIANSFYFTETSLLSKYSLS